MGFQRVRQSFPSVGECAATTGYAYAFVNDMREICLEPDIVLIANDRWSPGGVAAGGQNGRRSVPGSVAAGSERVRAVRHAGSARHRGHACAWRDDRGGLGQAQSHAGAVHQLRAVPETGGRVADDPPRHGQAAFDCGIESFARRRRSASDARLSAVMSWKPRLTAARRTAENHAAGMLSLLIHCRAERSSQSTSAANCVTVGQRRIRGSKNGFMDRDASHSIAHGQ